MGKIIVGMTMSLDGFVSDQSGSVARLYPDFEVLKGSERLQESMKMTGAVVMGKHAFEMAEDPDSYADTYEYQVPIFVLTHQLPAKMPKQNERLTFTFVTDGIESAVQQAKAAAGDKDVTIIGGASTIQQCIRARLVDELEIDIMPILLNNGTRLFEALGNEPIMLEKIDVIEIGSRTAFRFRIP
jgi:dihydrofolate reductase